MSAKQSMLDVGDTRKPIALKNRQRVTTGDINAMAMCAHEYDPMDVMGWYTGEFDDILRELICSNVASVIARLSTYCECTRGELSNLHPSDDLWVGVWSGGPEQSSLIKAATEEESE